MKRQIKALIIVSFIFFFLLQLIFFIGDSRSYAEAKYPLLYKKSIYVKESKLSDSNNFNPEKIVTQNK